MEGRKALLIFAFVGVAALGGSALAVNGTKKFDIINLKLNWTAALDACKERHWDLATIRSQEENDQLIRTWDKTIPGVESWLGATTISSLKGYFWMTNGDALNSGYENWLPNEPDNAGGIERCLSFGLSQGNTGWNDLRCDAEIPFACEYYS